MLDATRWIEEHNNEFYNQDAAVVDRVFGAYRGGTPYWGYADPVSCLRLKGDRDNPLCPGIFTAVGLVVSLDTELDYSFATALVINTDFVLAPASAPLGPSPRPYTELRTVSGGSYASWGYSVRVTAKFGWPAVPAGIRDGCVELAGILLGDSPLAARQFTDIGTVGASLEARGIVQGLIEVYGPGVVVA